MSIAIASISAPKTGLRIVSTLLVGASGLALATPSLANDVLFNQSEAAFEEGKRMTQSAGLLQVSLTGGGVASFVDGADFTINRDGSIDLYGGAVTVAGAEGSEIVVRMPEGLEGRVAGRGSSGNFSVAENGEARGHALTGAIRVGPASNLRQFSAAEMWRARSGDRPRLVVSIGAQTQPVGNGGGSTAGQVAALGSEAGPVGAALNGIPVTLGDALAAAGASSDIIAAGRRVELAAANPAIETFPSGDLALLIAASGGL
ncbi:MAG: hypothetical protein KJ703_07370, partial [Alphaproteobacteria bacterium]|nr:hypothetical protein [Alphaproteobacteria bacterium]